MLEGLGLIKWSALTHAYGEASDVPALIRTLLSEESTERQRAIWALFGNIWHQGTVYPATAAAVPFLYELLEAPNVFDKSSIAHLLSCIADGRGYIEVHAPGEEAWFEEILAEQGMTLAEELKREAAEIQAVREAAAAKLELLYPYLNDNDPELRASLAAALGNYPTHASISLPALKALKEVETDSQVCEMIQESLERLSKSASD